MSQPEVSVVMSVYNGANEVCPSIDSILYQQGVNFEFIIVNDGSTDDTGRILDDYAAKDCRIKVIHQRNQGLTKALIHGCNMACGEYISRQDAGDLSLPGKLHKLISRIRSDQRVSLVSCGTRFVGPLGEFLHDVFQSEQQATQGLQTLTLEGIQGPSSHPSTLFRRSDYLSSGGYRSEFRVAQDLDLWLRLVEQGRHVAIPDILYEAKVTAGSISGSQNNEQIETAKYILECARLRRSGLDETPILKKAEKFSQHVQKKKPSRRRKANGLYFIGSCLSKRDLASAIKYYRKAIKEYPLHLKSWHRILFLHLRSIFR